MYANSKIILNESSNRVNRQYCSICSFSNLLSFNSLIFDNDVGSYNEILLITIFLNLYNNCIKVYHLIELYPCLVLLLCDLYAYGNQSKYRRNSHMWEIKGTYSISYMNRVHYREVKLFLHLNHSL